MTISAKWSRKCQECFHVQSAVMPEYGTEPTDSYRGSKCKKCKSEALDYGRERLYNDATKQFLPDTDDENDNEE